jgi:hypothetical protein
MAETVIGNCYGIDRMKRRNEQLKWEGTVGGSNSQPFLQEDYCDYKKQNQNGIELRRRGDGNPRPLGCLG